MTKESKVYKPGRVVCLWCCYHLSAEDPVQGFGGDKRREVIRLTHRPWA